MEEEWIPAMITSDRRFFSNVRDDMSICQNEILAPLYIKTFENIQQAIDKINKGEKPLSFIYLPKRFKRDPQKSDQRLLPDVCASMLWRLIITIIIFLLEVSITAGWSKGMGTTRFRI